MNDSDSHCPACGTRLSSTTGTATCAMCGHIPGNTCDPPRMREPEPTAEEVVEGLQSLVGDLAEAFVMNPEDGRLKNALAGAIRLLSVAREADADVQIVCPDCDGEKDAVCDLCKGAGIVLARAASAPPAMYREGS